MRSHAKRKKSYGTLIVNDSSVKANTEEIKKTQDEKENHFVLEVQDSKITGKLY